MDYEQAIREAIQEKRKEADELFAGAKNPTDGLAALTAVHGLSNGLEAALTLLSRQINEFARPKADT
jgi:hypothetical protein